MSPGGAHLFAGGGSGVFLSSDNGNTWSSGSAGLPTGVNSLAVSADGSILLAGTTGRGVWKRPILEVIGTSTGVHDNVRSSQAASMLLANCPNPFVGATTFHYALPRTMSARLVVYDLAGRAIRTLVDGPQEGGQGQATWDGRDANGSASRGAGDPRHDAPRLASRLLFLDHKRSRRWRAATRQRRGRPTPMPPHPDTLGRDRQSAASTTAVPAIVRGAVAIAMIIASLVALRWCQEAPRRAVESAGHALQDALGTLFVGELTTRFVSMAPELAGGAALELATLKVPERIERERVRRFLGVQARTTVAIEVPVNYRYQVPWDQGWRITLTAAPGGVPATAHLGTGPSVAPGAGGRPMVHLCLVDAPALVPGLPPAIDTRTLRIQRTKDWALQRVPDAMVDSLLVQITPLIMERAASAQYKALVRETARQRLAQFVRLWVLQQDEIDSAREVQVIVRFADDGRGVGELAPARPPVEFH